MVKSPQLAFLVLPIKSFPWIMSTFVDPGLAGLSPGVCCVAAVTLCSLLYAALSHGGILRKLRTLLTDVKPWAKEGFWCVKILKGLERPSSKIHGLFWGQSNYNGGIALHSFSACFRDCSYWSCPASVDLALLGLEMYPGLRFLISCSSFL